MKKALTVTVLLFACYNLSLVIFSPAEKGSTSQNQWQNNIIKGQKYIYNGEEFRIVFVGTSLTYRLPLGSLPPNSFNLAFAGRSVFDGLDIIKKSHCHPDAIFIESNLSLNNPYYDVSKKLFTPIMYSLRKFIPALKEENQPLCYYFAFKGQLHKYIKEFKNLISKNNKIAYSYPITDVKKKPSKKSSDIVENRLDQLIPSFNDVPSELEIKTRMEVLKGYVNYFKQQGIKIIFLEIPFHERVYHTKFVISTKSALYKYFPPDEYTYMSYPNPSKLETTDGLHLVRSSAKIFAQYVTNEYNSLLKSGFHTALKQ